MRALTKRDFLLRSATLALGSLLVGSGIAPAAPKARQLRASVNGATNRAFAGMRRRFGRLRVSSIDDAFRLANRKTEIEITLS